MIVNLSDYLNMRIKIFLILFFLLSFNLVRATDFYVNSLTGSDIPGNGTLPNPWKTITYALSQISGTGHRVYVAGGTYNTTLGESFPILMKNGISLVGDGDSLTIMDAAGTNRVLSCVGITDPSTFISGFTIKGGVLGSSLQGGGILISAGSVLTVRNNKISNNSVGSSGYGGGIYITNSSPLISSNTIINNSLSTSGYGNAIAIYNSSPLIKRNRIINNKSGYEGCIYVYGSSSSPRILNNIIAKNVNSIYCDAGTPTIINNTISDNSGDAIYIGYGKPDSIVNNIISFNSGCGIYEYSSSYDPGIVSFNLFYANDGGAYFDEGLTGYYTSGQLNISVAECKNNIDGDPLFAGRVNSDYHELQYSTAIDAGDPTFLYNIEPSPNGGRINIGAYGNTEEAVSYLEPPVLPADLYVNASTGNNTTGDGSSGNPWKTITYALTQLFRSGHTIHIAAGTYNTSSGETFPIEMKNGVSLSGAGASTSIINADKTNRIFNCTGITDPLTFIEGFTITGGYISGDGMKGGGIYISGGTVLTLRNNTITNNNLQYWGEGGGIFISRSSPYVINNTISNNSAGWVGDGNAIAIYSSSPLIKNNIMTGNTGTGNLTSSCIFISDYSGYTCTPRIIGNLIARNYQNGIMCDDGSPTIINNTISDNSDNGIYIFYSTPDSIFNNIISYNTGYGIYEYMSGYDPGKVWYNLFYVNEKGLYYDEGSTGYFTGSSLNTSVAECKNNIDGDPLFVNKTIDNYYIRIGSPAINAGDPASPLDPDGSRADIGAYYYIPPPDAPVALAATAITHYNFYANWNASSSAAGYYLDVASDAGFTVFVSGYNNKNVTNVTTFLVVGLNPNTTYYYRVRAYNGTGTSGSSNVINPPTLQIPAPMAPVAVAGTNIYQTSFNANWNSSATATGYYLDVATDNAFTNFITGFNNKDVANVTSSTVTSLSAFTTYYYRVRAYNAGGVSSNSNIVGLTTLQVLPPGAPVATAASDFTLVSFKASWNSSATATGYYLDVATDAGFAGFVSNFSNRDVGNITFCQVVDLAPNTTYYYRVRAYNAGGTSSSSSIISTITLPFAPSPPSVNAATNIGQTDFTASWNSSPEATGYYMDVATDIAFTAFVPGYNNKDVLNVLSNNITGLTAYTNYYYRVRAYNRGGSGNNSEIIALTTLLNPPPPPSAPISNDATNITQVSFIANWTIAASATGYKLDVAANNTFTNFVNGYNDKDILNGTSFSITGLTANTTYYYRVRAYNSGGASPNSGTITVATLPNQPVAPVCIAANNLTQTSFTANWNSSATATGYYIDVATDNTFATFITGFNNKDVLNVLTFNIAGLTLNTTYYYRVRAYNTGGSSVNSNTITATTLLTIQAPSAPTANSASAILQNSFSTQWSSSPTATGYYVDVAINSAFTTYISGYYSRDVGNVTSLVVTGLSSNSIFFYRVKAYNSGGSSSFSNIISVTTLPYPPSAPTTLSAGSITSTAFTAYWNSSSGATGYCLDIATDNAFTVFVTGFNNKDVGNVTSTIVTGLTANITYYYRVRAYNSGGTSSNSNIITATLLPDPPASPLVLTAGSIAQTSFTAKWNSSSTATGYRLDVASDNGFATLLSGYSNLNVGNVSSYTIAGLTAKTIYYYRVRAYNSGGTSGNSNSITATTLPNPPAAPSGLSASSCNNTVTLTWSPNSESDFLRYRIYGSSSPNPTTFIDSTTNQISDVTKKIYGLVNGQTYYFRVSALISPGVEGALSTSASVKVKTGVVPKIKAKWNDILIAYNSGDSIASFQWYSGDGVISNANKQYYITNKHSGSYYLMATDKDGCKNSSNVITISGTKSMSIFPNPASTRFNISLNSNSQGETLIKLYNTNGIKVLEFRTEKPETEFNREITVNNLQDGIYTIEVSVNKEEIQYSRLVIIK